MSPEVQYLKIGENTKIHCNSRSLPIWKFRGEKLKQKVKQYIDMEGTLHLYNVTEENEGYYICIGTDRNRRWFHVYSRVIIISML